MITSSGLVLITVGRRRFKQEERRIATPKTRLAGIYEARNPPGT